VIILLDINLLREKPELVKASEKKRGKDPKQVKEVLLVDGKWKAKLKKVEELKHKRNVVSLEINELKKKGKAAAAKAKIKEMKRVVKEIKEKEEEAEKLLAKRNLLLGKVGNILHEKVPEGKDEQDNIVLREEGKKPKFNFKLKNHVQLIEDLDLGDFDASAKTSGKGFYFLKGELGLLQQALVRLAIEFMQGKGYTYIEPPLMLRKKILGAALDLEEFEKTIYSIEGEDLCLIGTSEYSLLGMHAGEFFGEKELPKKYFAYSMCFRKEVGAHGINEKGLWRTHQFNKVEQFIFCRPEDSWKYFEELLKNSEEILKALELPYRVIEICSGDLSSWKAKSYDLEVWRPTIGDYGEVMSLSNCTDYQARELGIKVVGKGGERRVVHTLNNTVLATSRIMVAILENHQTKEGTVKVPKILWPYMEGIKELGKKAKKR